ncbi:PP2C family serine/threonine-protein phosphatase [Kibdelosporangium persicum]|uniref:Serine/threonine-protein phosphatase n=1 Tax=Kibdelosporangium persicum TaxID=2698649 RepID=A0ABX2EYD6_9PSEU|nr:protein phosphatase 2C domain-containing protein [Kibdelosporangium persicum]NRN64002.1 Serine/threonine-protein phosphatase [Kibdelosporangium persicum]
MTLALKYAARSDRGLHRSNNEDSVYAGPHLLAIADGMGGHAAGEVASKVVIAALAPLDEDVPGDDLLGKLHEAVISGNHTIAELVEQDPDLEGMGTTLTAILFGGGRLGLVNIGDSRTYLLRDGQFNQITRDDSFVQSLLDEGRITPEEALTHPQRSLVLRALVGHEVIEPTLQVREARVGDRYLLCSDGLSDVVGFEKLAETMQIPDRQMCADKMIELALQGGGPDNVTVIVADVVDEEPQVTQSFDSSNNHMQPVGPTTSPPRQPVPMPPQQQPPHQQQPTMQQQQQPPPPPQKKKRGRKIAIIVAAAVILLALAAAGIRYLAYTNYYVGVSDGGEIAVFQGVRGTVLGVELHRKVEGSCAPIDGPTCQPLRIDDLGASNKTKANEGFPVGDLEAARQTINTWRREDQQQPQEPTDCPPPTSSVPTTPASTPAGGTVTTPPSSAPTDVPSFPGETTTPPNC